MWEHSAQSGAAYGVDQLVAVSWVQLNLLNAARAAALESYGHFGLPTRSRGVSWTEGWRSVTEF